MGLFDGINTATSTGGGVYLKGPGLFQVSITQCMMFHTRKKVDAFICNFIVVASSHAECPVGLKAGWFNGSDKEPFLGNLADFLRPSMVAFGIQRAVPPQVIMLEQVPVDEAMVQWVTSKEVKQGDGSTTGNPLKGIQLRVQTTMITTKGGSPFTLHKWEWDPMVDKILPLPELKAA